MAYNGVGRFEMALPDGSRDNPKYMHLPPAGEVVDDKLAPQTIQAKIRSETGEYLRAEAGHVVVKILVQPEATFDRIDSGMYTLDAIKRIFKWVRPQVRGPPTLSEQYHPIIAQTTLQFMANTRICGVTTVRDTSDHQHDMPSATIPLILMGRLEVDTRSARDGALKIPADEFIYGENPLDWQGFTRLEVFQLVTRDMKFYVLVTKFYDFGWWFNKTVAGINFRQTLGTDFCGFAKIGYHFENKPNKRVVEVSGNGDRFLQKFIFEPKMWSIYTDIITIESREMETNFIPTFIEEAFKKLKSTTDPDIASGIKPWYC